MYPRADAIYRIGSDRRIQKIASGSDLGLAVSDSSVWAVTFGGSELYRIENGKKTDVVTLPKGSLDGLLRLDDGTFLISSWDAKAVYRGPANGPFQPLIEAVDAPADLGYDSKRNRLLIPHFMENRVTIHQLE